MINIFKLLWVPVHQGEPTALHLHHDAVSLAERMKDIGHRVLNLRDFARHKGFRI